MKNFNKIWSTNFFCWTNFIKIRKFLLNQEEFGTNCAVDIDKHTKISVEFVLVDIQKIKYQQIISINQYIGWSLLETGQISL